jgi:molybdate-binding protein
VVGTHTEVARAIAEDTAVGGANAGLGIETAALAYNLDFVPLTTERYDFVIPAEIWEHDAVVALAGWLTSAEARADISALGGYLTEETGRVTWVD